MYSIRVRLDENDPNSKVIEGTPKEVFSKIKDMYNDEKTIFLKIEEVMYRLARISHETYNISHSDYLLYAIARKIEDNLYPNEDRDQNPLNIELNTIRQLITINLHNSPLSFKNLKFRKNINKIGLSKSTPENPVYFFDDSSSAIRIKDFRNIIINSYHMKRDINKFCLRLRILEKEVFAINEKEFRTPVDITALIRNNPYDDTYRYLEKKKVLFIDSDRMLHTLEELNYEYKKIHPYEKDLFNGKYVNGLIDNKIRKEDTKSERIGSARDVLIEILEEFGVGRNLKEEFYIFKKDGCSKNIIYGRICFVAAIIYAYYKTNENKIKQTDFFTNMYFVNKDEFDKFDFNKNTVIFTKKTVLKKTLPNKFCEYAISTKKNMDSENPFRKEIKKWIEEHHPEYLINIHKTGYPYQEEFFNKCEIFN